MPYTPGNEVANFPTGSQFEGGESAYLCVFFGCADIAASSRPGYAVGQSWEWVDQKADSLANEVQGSGAFETSQGASLQDEYDALQKLGLTYTEITVSSSEGDSGTLSRIKQAINDGKPVLLCGAETGFIDEATGTVDYHWTPTGNHCIVVTGYQPNGNLIVRDYAAVGNNFVPGSKRTYVASKIVAVSATAVQPYWWTPAVNVPGTGWHDDGTTLTAPNGKVFVKGFRDYILGHKWDPADVPFENEHGNSEPLFHNQSVGSGTSQCTRDHYFWWTPAHGVICEPQLGSEIFALQQKLASQPQPQVTAPAKSSPQSVEDIGQAIKEAASAEGQPVAVLLMQLYSDLASGSSPVAPSQAAPALPHPEPPPLPAP